MWLLIHAGIKVNPYYRAAQFSFRPGDYLPLHFGLNFRNPSYIYIRACCIVYICSFYHSVHKFTTNNPKFMHYWSRNFQLKILIWQFIGSFASAFGGLVLRVPHFVQPCHISKRGPSQLEWLRPCHSTAYYSTINNIQSKLRVLLGFSWENLNGKFPEVPCIFYHNWLSD